MSQLLTQLLAELATGRLSVVDLTQPLSPQTPLLPLPPQFNNTPAFKISELSHYDERGPAWYWNGFETGEHTGTHFDAPIHWVSGKDLPENSVDRIQPKKFIGPACVIDISVEAARDPNYLLTPQRIGQWEDQNGRIPAGAWVLLRTDWSKRKDAKDYINAKENGPHTPGLAQESSALLAKERDVLGVGVVYARIGYARRLDRDQVLFTGIERSIRDYEAALEITYQARIAPWWLLQPDLQLIFHPGGLTAPPGSSPGARPIPNALVVGLRSGITF